MCMRGTQARPRDPCCIRSVRLQNMQAVRMQHGTCRPPSQQKCCSARARVPSCSIHPRQQIASAPAKALSQRAGACGASSWLPTAVGAACAAAVAVQLVAAGGAWAATSSFAAAPEENLDNIPSQLSSTGEDAGLPLSSYFRGNKKRSIEDCTGKCMPTCIRGGGGSPGLGPISMRKDMVVFKEGFRSRQYCLSECAQVCSLSIQGPPSEAASRQLQQP